MAKKKIVEAPKEKRVRYYGMVKVKKGQKLAWVSKEDKNGWSLGLIVGGRTLWLRNLRFASPEEVERAAKSLNIAFLHKVDSKFPVK